MCKSSKTDKPSTQRAKSTRPLSSQPKSSQAESTSQTDLPSIEPDPQATLSLSPKQQAENWLDISDQVTVREHRGNSLASSGLHIRCPHCHNQVEFLEEHEASDITCGTCGSIFSIINPEGETRHAKPLKTVGQFELIARVGIGSFGAVWKAYDPKLDRAVAVKIPRRGQLDPLDEAQFLREARVTAQLRHPNIVSVHEIGREGDSLYIVSDLVRGVTLSERLTAGQMPCHEILDVCLKVANALQHAHSRGIIHRDLKPSNIMTDQQGEPFLTDFGLAKRDVGEITMTADGQILGTPAYMSPEQAAGEAHHVDRRTDIYALGVVLFELLTGELPFRGSAQMQIHQKITEDAPDPRTLNRLVPRDLATICLKCIQREPNRRYRSVEALSTDLSLFERGEPILARPISRAERAIRWARRHPATTTIGLLLALLAVVGPLVALRYDRLRQRAEDLVAQKEQLIENRDAKINASAATIASLEHQAEDLQNQLEAWEGGADSSAIWPPYKTRAPREELLVKMVSDSTYTVQMLLAKPGDEQQALVQLALGTAHEALGNRKRALTRFDAARKLLEKLCLPDNDRPQYVQALADCLQRMALLKSPEDRESRVKLLRQAQSLQERLTENDHRLPLRAALFDSQLRLTIEEGLKASPENLRRVEQTHQQLVEHKARNPQELYELACFLSDCAPWLLYSQPKESQNR